MSYVRRVRILWEVGKYVFLIRFDNNNFEQKDIAVGAWIVILLSIHSWIWIGPSFIFPGAITLINACLYVCSLFLVPWK